MRRTFLIGMAQGSLWTLALLAVVWVFLATRSLELRRVVDEVEQTRQVRVALRMTAI